MQTKRFSGDTIDDVLMQVRGELGEDAVILETRRIVRGGIGGFFGKAGIEVTAADAMPTDPGEEVRETADADEFLRRLEEHLAESGGAADPAPDAGITEDPEGMNNCHVEGESMSETGIYERPGATMVAVGDQERARAIIEAARAAVREVAEQEPAPEEPAAEAVPAAGEASAQPAMLRLPAPAADADAADARDDADEDLEAQEPEAEAAPRARRAPGRALPSPAGLDDVRRDLEAAGVEERRLDMLMDGFVRSIAPFMEEGAGTRDVVRDYLMARVPVVRDRRPRRRGHTIAFVGQSGVGKSSAAAKVAGRYAQAGFQVVLISAGAPDNAVLDDLGRDLGVSVFHAADADELRQATRTMRDRDLVVIDTPGCAHTAPDALARLRTLLDGAGPDEVHLTLPAATAPIDLGDLQAAFRPVGVTRITITKLDETRRFGGVINAPMRIGRPLAYIADGASVPGSIAPADPRLVAELLLP